MQAFDLTFKDINQIINFLKIGKVGVLPTDTIYGIAGSALNLQTVGEIYLLRKRDLSKPMIILISSLEDLQEFNIVLSLEQTNFLKQIWPNPISVVLPCLSSEFTYLHRNKESLAFRMPKKDELLGIIKEVGPIVAPSANIEGEKVAENITQAKEYFNNKISFYVNGGEVVAKSSTIIQLYEDGTKIVLREGEYKIS